MLTNLDKFNVARKLGAPASETLFLPVGEFEIQYIVNKNGALQMPISINIVDDSSLLACYDFVTTTDQDAQKVILNFRDLAKSIFETNQYYVQQPDQ